MFPILILKFHFRTDGLCLRAFLVFFVVRFSVVVSVVLLSPFSMSSLFNKRPVLSPSAEQEDVLPSVSSLFPKPFQRKSKV